MKTKQRSNNALFKRLTDRHFQHILFSEIKEKSENKEEYGKWRTHLYENVFQQNSKTLVFRCLEKRDFSLRDWKMASYP